MSNSEQTPPLSDAEGEWTTVSQKPRNPSRGGYNSNGGGYTSNGGDGGGGNSATPWERGARSNTGRGGGSGAPWERGAHNNRNNTGRGGGNAEWQALQAKIEQETARSNKKTDVRRRKWYDLERRIEELFTRRSGPDRTKEIAAGIEALCQDEGEDAVQQNKIIEEVVRYLEPEVIRLLVKRISCMGRTPDGFSMMHWAVWPKKGLCDDMTADDMLTRMRTTIRTLIDECGCSPFKVNKHGETSVDAARIAASKGVFPKEILSGVLDALVAQPASSGTTVTRMALLAYNMINDPAKPVVGTASMTEAASNGRRSAALLCWALVKPGTLADLVSKCVTDCMKTASIDKQNSVYGKIKGTITRVIRVLTSGPPKSSSLDRFFKQNPFNSHAIVKDFKQSVVDMVTAINPADVDKAVMAADTLGAILAEVGSPSDIDAYIARSIDHGSIMNAMTCIGHSSRITQGNVLKIAACTGLDNRTRFTIDDVLTVVAGTRVQISDAPNFIYRDNLLVGLRQVNRVASVAASNNRGVATQAARVSATVSGSNNRGGAAQAVHVPATVSDSSPSQQTADYVPPFDFEAPAFGVAMLETIDPAKLSKNADGTLVPPMVDNIVYSLKKRPALKHGDVATLLFQIVESMKDANGCMVAKFVLDNCGLTQGQIKAAVKALVNVPVAEMPVFFDNRHASEHIKWFARAYAVETSGGGGSK